MKTTAPVTVIIRAHNAEATIAQAIASTLKQSFTDLEAWVLENGSHDRTAEVARRFKDPRLKVFELGPVGQGGAIQFALENAPSEWIAMMDADDLMFPDRLTVQLSILRQRPDLVMIGTAFARLTPFGHIFEKSVVSPVRELDATTMSRGKFFADGSVIFNRQAALDVGLDREFRYADLPLFFRLLSRGTALQIPQSLYLYRIQPTSMSRTDSFYEETRRMRARYSPQTLHYFPENPQPSSLWRSIAGMELLAGDGRAIRQAAQHLEQDGFPTEAKYMRWRSYLCPPGRLYYQWRRRSIYRHRHDWERLFAPLLKLSGPNGAGS
jgi:glycosyltransferase involved in cell wall biosynthesis